MNKLLITIILFSGLGLASVTLAEPEVGDATKDTKETKAEVGVVKADDSNAKKEDAKEAVVYENLNKLPNKQFKQHTVITADSFTYTDPIDKSISDNQGVRIVFEDGARIIFRLSGTGTEGATLRVYIEKYVTDLSQFDLDTQDALNTLIQTAEFISDIEGYTGRTKPTVVT